MTLADVPMRLRDCVAQPIGRYLVIGASVYLFELLVIFMVQQLGGSALLAVGLSFWLGLILSFILTKFVTFQDRRTHRKVVIPQVIAVTLLVLFNFGFTILVTKLLIHALPAVATRTLALGITTIWNFYLYRTRIFKTSTPVID